MIFIYISDIDAFRHLVAVALNFQNGLEAAITLQKITMLKWTNKEYIHTKYMTANTMNWKKNIEGLLEQIGRIQSSCKSSNLNATEAQIWLENSTYSK